MARPETSAPGLTGAKDCFPVAGMAGLLNDEAEVEARAARLADSHIAPIEAWRRKVEMPGRPIPHVDPLDGGVGARLLLLLETPGPGAAPLRFVSRDNATGTGRNLRRFLAEAGIERRDLVIWNVVPWVVHAPGARNRAVRMGEVREGLAMLPAFLDLLPDLRAAVLMGRFARLGGPVIADARPDLLAIAVPHPSPTIVCTSPSVGARIAKGLTEAATILGAGPPGPDRP